MPNLLNSLLSSANALRVFERVLVVSQNNVANASTPGYAAQRLSLQAVDFQPELGLMGGVRAGHLESARSLYAEQAVRRQCESLGFFSQAAQSLAGIESAFDMSGERGISGALNRLFESFSAWSLTPNSANARASVIESAGQLSDAFHETASMLAGATIDADRQIRETIAQINRIGARLQEYNLEGRRGAIEEAGLDTRIQAALEELSELVNFDAIFQADGSVTVLLGGETPLVVGANRYEVSASFFTPSDPPPVYAGATPSAHVLDANGRDITYQIDQGKLGGLLNVRNEVLPFLRGDGRQPGELNRLAMSIADRVNAILTSGRVSDGPPPENGVPLFTYDAGNPTLAAQSLAVSPGITAEQLAAIDPGPPYVSNGTALRLAALASPRDASDKIDGFSYTEFYGGIAGRVGQALSEAREGQEFKAQMVSQARYLRNEISGVSLDEEAMRITEFQRAYQANARMVTLLDELTETAVNLLR